VVVVVVGISEGVVVVVAGVGVEAVVEELEEEEEESEDPSKRRLNSFEKHSTVVLSKLVKRISLTLERGLDLK